MTEALSQSPKQRPAIIQWLARLNSQVSQWAAGTSWWRMFLLFLVIIIAGSVISSLLHLEHERVRVPVPGSHMSRQPTEITIGGENGIKVTRKDGVRTVEIPAPPGVPVPPAPPGVPGTQAGEAGPAASASAPGGDTKARRKIVTTEDDDDDLQWTSRRVITARGILGDLGTTLIVILFAYLVAAKVVVRKVAQADAKVQTAVSMAERETMERQLTQARLQVLQAQVEPHFLFNTLAAVDYLIETDPPRASQMQKQLITYLRCSLPQMRAESSSLGREVDHVRSYLELIKMRIEERLQVEIAIPADLEKAEFPPMMLQSVVENAIKHGIEPKPEGGKVSISAFLQEDRLCVEVNDTGVGFNDDLEDIPRPKGTGIGLANIRERLAMLYGWRGRLTMRSDDGPSGNDNGKGQPAARPA